MHVLCYASVFPCWLALSYSTSSYIALSCILLLTLVEAHSLAVAWFVSLQLADLAANWSLVCSRLAYCLSLFV